VGLPFIYFLKISLKSMIQERYIAAMSNPRVLNLAATPNPTIIFNLSAEIFIFFNPSKNIMAFSL
jgi:hypothetical protein